ncbi:hypothetical protein [Lactiplantibacillus plantarum]|uniref:hypothetical protein n=1 Tax=Lactiplantibacillus plantarum TaxID=1590 RepID=UPI0028FC2919|nr:hypothetical protein [Lactiplantibacillus plantarum]WNW15010.1 hypothetical protein RUO99_10715 [Lactiplantibacillus plantarum]WNW17982.1 hypothetical protein RUP00_10705 [Lactiplantibacillus plantarum]
MTKSKKKKKRTYDVVKVCTVCGRPMRKKGQLCGSCASIRGKAKKIITGPYKVLTQYQLNYITKYIVKSYTPKIVLGWVAEHPRDFWTFIPQKSHQERMADRRELRKVAVEKMNSDESLNLKRDGLAEFPFLKSELERRENRAYRLRAIRGTHTNPTIFITCTNCHKDFVCTFKDFESHRFQHECPAHISTGETTVDSFLKSIQVKFVTQQKTLYCENPITKYQLPYDFELTEYKIIIEVQGSQHYKFIEYFHQTQQNFKYQQYKDKVKVKREYAENHGYLFLAINYPELETNKYKEIIQSAIHERINMKQ